MKDFFFSSKCIWEEEEAFFPWSPKRGQGSQCADLFLKIWNSLVMESKEDYIFQREALAF